jgi:hypothetical protein
MLMIDIPKGPSSTLKTRHRSSVRSAVPKGKTDATASRWIMRDILDSLSVQLKNWCGLTSVKLYEW